ncbi:DUF3995 domain-containing protein [Lacinutrix sp. Hel_I_90]|uniref:DUF3995 domain-containing protein n=1 Tax=Lacinutrix sp. Hel_I_90 TaxID=1249999 RepID=UPI001E571034|nr:DUF3995 domain-containing protein [Lacinutrix sp. Hel_I_90]
MMVLSILLSLILIALGIIHFSWVFGGTFWFTESLPTNENGKRVLNPKKMDSAIVGLGLTTFGLFYLINAGVIPVNLPEQVIEYVGWIIPTIFLLRAIGEFKYVGFFKRIKHTEFGKRDTKLFSPLCLIISLFGILIQLAK